VKAGVALSVSGPFAPFGRQALAALRLWADDSDVSLVVEDDEGKAGRCRRAVERLVREHHVDVLFGPYGSSLTLAAADVAEQHEHVLWNHGGSSNDVFERGARWIVGIPTPASRYFEPVLRRVTSPARVAVLAAETGFSASVARGAVAAAESQGHRVAQRTYASGTTDFRLLLEGLAAEPIDLLLGVGRFEDDVRLARQMRELGFRVPVVAVVAAGVLVFGEALGADAEGFFGPSQWEPGLPQPIDVGPTAEWFVRAYTARTGELPDYPAAQAYAAGLLASRCASEVGLEQRALREAASRLRCTTLYGSFAIDRRGQQVAHDVVVVRWEHGRKRLTTPRGARLREPAPNRPGRA
jgi:branched-chain amino acid transport system substrate-binding protein